MRIETLGVISRSELQRRFKRRVMRDEILSVIAQIVDAGSSWKPAQARSVGRVSSKRLDIK